MESTTTKRSRRAAGEMLALMKTYEEGGQKRGDFCATHNLKLWVFSYWRKKYLASKLPEPEPPKFVALLSEQRVSSDMVLSYGEVELRLQSGVGADFVGDLVLKLAERC